MDRDHSSRIAALRAEAERLLIRADAMEAALGDQQVIEPSRLHAQVASLHRRVRQLERLADQGWRDRFNAAMSMVLGGDWGRAGVEQLREELSQAASPADTPAERPKHPVADVDRDIREIRGAMNERAGRDPGAVASEGPASPGSAAPPPQSSATVEQPPPTDVFRRAALVVSRQSGETTASVAMVGFDSGSAAAIATALAVSLSSSSGGCDHTSRTDTSAGSPPGDPSDLPQASTR